VLSLRDPAQLPWKDLGVDVVFESTGLFTERDAAAKHLAAGAKKVVITAPAKKPDVSVVLGVNDEQYDPAKHHIISNASCTTNCLAPLAKVLHQTFGIRKGWMTTIHSYTNDQQLLDLPHKDLRRRRAGGAVDDPDDHRRGGGGRRSAAGAERPAGRHLDARADAERVVRGPRRAARQEGHRGEVNAAFKAAADGPLKGLLACSTEELVSIDFKGNPHSSIIDMPYTKVMDGDFVKVLSWYDNEWGYSNRCVDLLRKIVKRGI
jgi:glyceraldehyde 3-phosphate dehydrogenase